MFETLNILNRIKTVEELDQRYMLVPADVKDAYLIHTIDKYKEENPRSSIMVFVQTCKSVDIYTFSRVSGVEF